MMKQNEAHVKLMIYKYQGSLSEITSVLGITPSETHEDGDPSPGSVKRWQLDSSLDSSKDVEEHLDALLNQLAELKSSLETITSRSQAQINVAYYTYEANPQIYLDKNLIKRIADLDIDLYLDMYSMPS